MGILNKIFGSKKTNGGSEHMAPSSEPECSHTALAPHWDNLQDMGKPELATYTCEACGDKFSADEASALMDQPPPALLAVSDDSTTS